MEENLVDPRKFPQRFDAMKEQQWYKPNTVYQILEVRQPREEKTEEKNIVTTILAKERGTGLENIQQNSFDMYPLDQETINKLQNYSPKGNGSNISSYLPSSGVIFSKDFFEALSNVDTKKVEQIEISNFYHPMRTLLYSRKISQLISKTWWSYLVAKDEDYNVKNNIQIWKNFTDGKWNEIIKYNDTESNIKGIDILDGLIAREIFLFGGADSPDYPDPENPSYYSHLKDFSTSQEQARFLILPSSRGWQGISLSLLLAGQAYYKREEGYYHQISQPIFSTGEITMLHSLEVDWGKFHGDIKEIIIHHDKPWVGYHIVIPYPPIPFYAEPENIKKWAWAQEEYSDEVPENERHFPFYKKEDTTGKYLIDVDYFKPPYPYIPLSCS
ncbi:MAG: hypothetical protein V7L26_00955 [Nostoc sp.]|uniref:hypothetical protein n=1 Tax=Nostoc sp. TaxID=1180 RepID=UPI002FEF848B